MAEVHVDIVSDLGRAVLPDRRLRARLALIGERIQAAPAASFPDVFHGRAELEAFYRFTNNPRLHFEALQDGHAEAAWDRAKEAELVLIVHDTTECNYTGEGTRTGLSVVGQKQCFWAHTALAVAAEGPPRTYGVVGMHPYTQEDKLWVRHHGDGRAAELAVGSERWLDLVTEVVHDQPAGKRVVHVMDRESDDYVLLSHLIALGQSFVARSAHDRVLADDKGNLREQVQKAPVVIERLVYVGARSGKRPPKSKKQHPDREARKARLSVRAATVTLRRPPAAAPMGESTMMLNVVEVVEVDPPEGAEPISWWLLTDLPIETTAQVERIIDIYRRRWLIEEYFKSLKTGCAFRERQASSLQSLLNVFSLLAPVACRLLNLRTLSRDPTGLPWSEVLDEIELLALRQMAPKSKLPREPTAYQVMRAIASVGGHLPSNGEPGWLVLGRGFRHLLEYAEGWKGAIRHLAETGKILA